MKKDAFKVGDVLFLDGLYSKLDGHKVTLSVVFSEVDGAFMVHDGSAFCHFLSKRKIRNGEIKAMRVEDIISNDDSITERLRELKALGAARSEVPAAYMDWYRDEDPYASFEENRRYLVEAIERNGYLDVVSETGII